MNKLFAILMFLIVSISACTAPSASEQTTEETDNTGASGTAPTGSGDFEDTPETPTNPETNEETKPVALHIIEMTDTGYEPSTITINVGDTIEFRNTGTRSNWPASNAHPTHKNYGGTSLSEHCAAPNENTFDSCGAVPSGESWFFKFQKTGSWSYHDHTRTSFGGTVVVE